MTPFTHPFLQGKMAGILLNSSKKFFVCLNFHRKGHFRQNKQKKCPSPCISMKRGIALLIGKKHSHIYNQFPLHGTAAFLRTMGASSASIVCDYSQTLPQALPDTPNLRIHLVIMMIRMTRILDQLPSNWALSSYRHKFAVFNSILLLIFCR